MMATIALPRPIPPHRASSGITSLAPSSIPIDNINAAAGPIPNKHLPTCPPGPVPVSVPQQQPARDGPQSPEHDPDCSPSSFLHPPDRFPRLRPTDGGSLSLYQIAASDIVAALDHTARQPLPSPAAVFPWLHGLNPANHIQQAFFVQRRRALRKTPRCLRGLTLVKADGDLATSRLKGAIAPHEFLQPGDAAEFLDVDPRDGFSVRNFQIQAAKNAMTSDIIVYGDDELLVRRLGWDIANAQHLWRQKHEAGGDILPRYNTFVCLAPFSEFEQYHPGIVAVASAGHLTGSVVDLFSQERKEMYAMTQASEISHNVWLGPTPDPGTDDESGFDVLIECTDMGQLNPDTLQSLVGRPEMAIQQAFLEFPSSGSILPPTWSQSEADGILETCKSLYHLAHGTCPTPSDGLSPSGLGEVASKTSDVPMAASLPPRKILIHCQDGYTETTLLGIAYLSYSTGTPVPQAWLDLHTVKKRNFFAYPTDVALLNAIAARLLTASPACAHMGLADVTAMLSDEPKWLPALDGSFPSRILDYMYLGNLGHANNTDLLKVLGIGQILSVGEMVMWREGELEEWGPENVCNVQGVQDNGIDPLTSEFERCLDFIERGRRNDTATLVHCRVGVSRSATICIAEVMREMKLSFPRAYSFVRARRLNVIIQPHLRFAYELLKWEELLQTRRCEEVKRELEWAEISREIALMNRPYAR
ncbi:hypothetical protein RB594_005199 [Gaeumannomyces avenae]